MSKNSDEQLDPDALAEVFAESAFSEHMGVKNECATVMIPLLIESLGSWQAAEAIGAFDFDDHADDFLGALWAAVPLSRGGGARTLEAEIEWKQVIAELRQEYGDIESEFRRMIDEKRKRSHKD